MGLLVGHDVYVDDVDDDEAGAGAYFFVMHIDTQINCTIKQWMDGSFGECSVEDQPVDCMPNVTRVSVEHNACY